MFCLHWQNENDYEVEKFKAAAEWTFHVVQWDAQPLAVDTGHSQHKNFILFLVLFEFISVLFSHLVFIIIIRSHEDIMYIFCTSTYDKTD
jgi:hypothetical protein